MQIKEQSPELANQSHVMQLTLDQVYDFAVNPSEQTLPPGNVMFRFMPDAQQVRHALQVKFHTSSVISNEPCKSDHCAKQQICFFYPSDKFKPADCLLASSEHHSQLHFLHQAHTSPWCSLLISAKSHRPDILTESSGISVWSSISQSLHPLACSDMKYMEH